MNPKHSLFFFYLHLVISNFYNRQTLKAKQTNKQKIQNTHPCKQGILWKFTVFRHILE